jgi:hypothetical protein
VSWALVLGGGGPSGLAWETGVLKGLLAHGADLTTPDLLVGADGAILAAHVATGESASPRSATSAALAFGHRLVIVVAVARAGELGSLDDELADEIAQLRAGGSHVELLLPDAASAAVLFADLADPARAAAAGYAQGTAQAATVRAWLASSAHRIPVVDAEDLAARFEALTLRKAEWTHLAHLAVGMWHVDRYGPEDALTRLRAGIRRLNESLGGQNTATAGYHETITAAYVRLLSAFLEACPPGLAWSDRVARLFASPLVEKDVLFRAYSRERLFSMEARASWVEPDLAPLTLNAVLAQGVS